MIHERERKPHIAESPGPVTLPSTKPEPVDSPKSDCMSGIGLSSINGMTMGLGSRHSGPSISNSLPIPPDPLGPMESPVSSFSVENFLPPTSHLANVGAGSDLVTSRPPPLVSPQVLQYSRTSASDLYRSGSVACTQGSGVSSTPPYTYHCHNTQAAFPPVGVAGSGSSSGSQHHQQLMSMSQSCGEETGGGSPHAPLSHSHSHSHSSPLSHQTNGLSPSSVFSVSQASHHYPRANGWYMSPTPDLNPGADFSMSSSPFAMFESQRLLSQSQSQASASCQLAAFRAPYKTATSYAYDCTKF